MNPNLVHNMTVEMQKCERCNGVIPNFSIAFAQLPDNEKCRCLRPILPPGPIYTLLKALWDFVR